MASDKVQLQVIENWMGSNADRAGDPNFDDLHIDQIDSAWKDRNSWLDGGIEALRLAIGVKNHKRLPVALALACSLKSGKTRRGMNCRSKEALAAQLDWSPPSLYLFKPGKEPWNIKGAQGLKLDNQILQVPFDAACYYIEFKADKTEEYSRTVFIA